MTQGEFEVFEIMCRDFIHNLIFYQKTSRDQYTREMLEDMITNVQRSRRVIAETIDSLTV